jgi:hypothetical protein
MPAVVIDGAMYRRQDDENFHSGVLQCAATVSTKPAQNAHGTCKLLHGQPGVINNRDNRERTIITGGR